MNAKPKEIIITHLINPHLFYYRESQDDVHENLNKLEVRILLHVEKNRGQKFKKNPMPGETVALKHDEFNKWIRCTYEGDGVYWCTDYGFPYRPKRLNIIALPMNLMKIDTKRIFLGGLADCLPAEKTYNINKNKVEYKERLDWSPKAIEMIQNINKMSTKIEFRIEYENLVQNQHFGHLTFYTPKPIMGFEMLHEVGEAVIRKDFHEYLSELRTIKKLRWKDNEGHLLSWQEGFVRLPDPPSDLLDSLNGLQISDSTRQLLVDDDVLSECDTVVDNEFFEKSASMIMGPEDLEIPKKIEMEQQISTSRAKDAARIQLDSFDGSDITVKQPESTVSFAYVDQQYLPTAKELEERELRRKRNENKEKVKINNVLMRDDPTKKQSNSCANKKHISINEEVKQNEVKFSENGKTDIKSNGINSKAVKKEDSVDPELFFLGTGGTKKLDSIENLPKLCRFPNSVDEPQCENIPDDVSELSTSPSMPGLLAIPTSALSKTRRKSASSGSTLKSSSKISSKNSSKNSPKNESKVSLKNSPIPETFAGRASNDDLALKKAFLERLAKQQNREQDNMTVMQERNFFQRKVPLPQPKNK